MLNYESRVLILTTAVEEFLSKYERPQHLKTDAQRLGKIKDIAEAINSKMSLGLSKEGFADQASRILKEMTLTHTYRQWPEPASFAKCAAGAVRHTEVKAIEGLEAIDPERQGDLAYVLGRYKATKSKSKTGRGYFPSDMITDRNALKAIDEGFPYDLIWEVFGKGVSTPLRAHLEANSQAGRDRDRDVRRKLYDISISVGSFDGTFDEFCSPDRYPKYPGRVGFVKGTDYTSLEAVRTAGLAG